MGMTSVPFLALCAEAALLTYFFSRKKVTSQVMKATRGVRYWSLVQKVLSLFRVTATYKGFGLWWGRSNVVGMKTERWSEREGSHINNSLKRARNKDKERLNVNTRCLAVTGFPVSSCITHFSINDYVSGKTQTE